MAGILICDQIQNSSNTGQLTFDNSGNFTTGNLICTGTITGGTGLLNIGSGQIYKDTNGNVGIGTSSPGYKLDVTAATRVKPITGTNSAYSVFENNGNILYFGVDNSAGTDFGSAYSASITTSGAYPLTFRLNNSEKMRLDSSGNLGLGVTPSAWNSNAKAIQLNGGSLYQYGGDRVFVGQNTYLDSNIYDRFVGNGWATMYRQYQGSHAWYNSGSSGTAGNVISWTQAMTLDASGNLLVGLTSNSGVRCYVKGEGSTNGTWSIYATNSSGTTQFGLRNDNYLYAPSVGGYGTTGTTVVVNGNYLGYLSSSIRFKKDIVDYDKGLTEILTLRPVYYKSKNPNPDGQYDEQRYAGLIAEEIADLGFDEFVLNGPDGKINSIQYGNMVSICIKSIQEQQELIEKLTARITALESK